MLRLRRHPTVGLPFTSGVAIPILRGIDNTSCHRDPTGDSPARWQGLFPLTCDCFAPTTTHTKSFSKYLLTTTTTYWRHFTISKEPGRRSGYVSIFLSFAILSEIDFLFRKPCRFFPTQLEFAQVPQASWPDFMFMFECTLDCRPMVPSIPN